MDNEDLKENLTSGNQWMRLIYMVLFAFLLEIAGLVMLAVVILQFLFSIITGSPNDNLRRLGDQIASYVYQTLQFLVYNTEEKPFPFAEWPESDIEDLSGYESAEEVEGEVVSDEPHGQSMYDPIELGSDEDAGEEKEKKEEEKEQKKSPPKKSPPKKSAANKSTAKKTAAKDSGSKDSAAKTSDDSAAADEGADADSAKGDDSDK